MSGFIARFNPYQMDDETILALATGRKQALSIALETIHENISGTGAERQHLLILGPRGRGKSFFIKYLRIQLSQDERFQNCRFILLPEEQGNIRFASDFIRMIQSQLDNTGFQSVITTWRESDTIWQSAYTALESWCKEQLAAHPDFLLVVTVENFQDFLEQLDDVGEHRIRHMMENLPGFMLIGATPFSRTDNDYNRPLFHIFKELPIGAWSSEDHLNYFRRRIELDKTGRQRSPEEHRLLEAKLLAISQFTGGSPRMAVVLTNLLLEDNVVSTARTLYGLVDELTPYYIDLTKEIPNNSRILFDALIRLGENLSQSELASAVGATQNEISKAFRWLHENGYVTGEKRTNSKEYRYYVSDRVFVLYYHQREVFHDKNYTPIWLLADFLTTFYHDKNELKREALFSLITEPSRDAEDLFRLYLRKEGKPEQAYAHERDIEAMLNDASIKEDDFLNVAVEFVKEGKYSKSMNYAEKLQHRSGISSYAENYLQYIQGIANQNQGKVEEAITHYNAVVQDGEDERSRAIWVRSRMALGHCFLGTKQYETALQVLMDTHEWYSIHKDAFTVKYLAREIGMIYMYYLRNLENAIQWLEQSVPLNSEKKISKKEKEVECTVYWNIGIALLGLKQYSKAAIAFVNAENRADTPSIQRFAKTQFLLTQILQNEIGPAWNALVKDYNNNDSSSLLSSFMLNISYMLNVNDIFVVIQRVFGNLSEHSTLFNIRTLLFSLFFGLVHNNSNPALLRDIATEARLTFTDPEHQLICDAALNCAAYMESGKSPAYLDTIPPDIAILVKSIYSIK